MTSSKPNHLPKAPSPNTTTVQGEEGRAPTQGSGVQYSVHSKDRVLQRKEACFFGGVEVGGLICFGLVFHYTVSWEHSEMFCKNSDFPLRAHPGALLPLG